MQRSSSLRARAHNYKHTRTAHKAHPEEKGTHTHTQVSYLHSLKEATVWRAGWHFHTETLSSDTERQGEREEGGGEREK